MTKPIRNNDELAALTQTQARNWLIKYDRDAAEFWQSLPDSENFTQAVAENIRDFGFQ